MVFYISKIGQYINVSRGSKAINASGLSEHSQITVEILNERFVRLHGYTFSDFMPLKSDSGIQLPVKWKHHDLINPTPEPIRIRVNWDGLRMENARVYAVYVNMPVSDC